MIESLQSVHQLYSLSNKKLVMTVDEFESELRRLKMENLVFEHFLIANEPSLVERLVKTMEKVQEMHIQATSESTRTLPSLTDGKSSQPFDTQSLSPSQADTQSIARTSKGPRINISQKQDLALREMDDIQLNLKKFIKKAHLEKNRLTAEIEETGIRNAELQEARNNFEQTVVIEGVEALTQKIPAEKFVRYMQEWLKFAQVMLEKLRLRTSSLRTQYHKLKLLRTQKEELGECVHEVDFEKLNIENKNFQLCIEQKNKHLLELKQMNGKANLLLTTHKNFLCKQQVMINDITERITTTQVEITQLRKDYDNTVVTLSKYQAKFDKMEELVSKYNVPDVMEYIVKKADLADLKKTLKVWLRKSNIQKIAMGTYTRTMCQLTGIPKPKASWFESTISTPDSFSDEIYENTDESDNVDLIS